VKEIKTHKGPKNENIGNIGQPLEYKKTTQITSLESG
jgi:hypothetical protein